MGKRLSKTECFLISRTPDLLKSGLTEELADTLIFLAKKYSKNFRDEGIINTDGVARYVRADGGEGSGNFGHKGRPGEIGGSAPGDGAAASGGSESGEKESSSSESKSSSSGTSSSGTSAVSRVKFGGAKVRSFISKLKAAKESCDPTDAWRVTLSSEEEFEEYHPNANCHITEGGSVAAVTEDGDIVSVCKMQGDSTNGKDLVAMAVEAGGVKLDSYDGNHGFYIKCGFEPVSWCKWDGDYAPDDWSSARDKPEDIIFYKYVGVGKTTSSYEKASDFKKAVAASDSYDDAQKVRDESL